MRDRLCLAVVICAALGAWLPAAAGADTSAISAVAAAFSSSSNGTVPACRFSSAELNRALSEAPAFDYQYEASLTDAIKAALAARADGQARCGHKGAAATSASRQRPAGPSPALPASIGSHPAAGLPLVVVGLLILAGLVFAGLGAGVVAAWLGWDPAFARAAMHSLREAEYRLGSRWDRLSGR